LAVVVCETCWPGRLDGLCAWGWIRAAAAGHPPCLGDSRRIEIPCSDRARRPAARVRVPV